MRLPFTTLLFIGLSFTSALAQSVSSGKQSTLRGEVEIGGLAAPSGQTPFWLRANQYGTVPLEAPFGTVRAGIARDYHHWADSAKVRRHKFDWGFGAYAVANAGQTNQAFLTELFGKVRYGWLELYGGRRREVLGIGDTTLTSGFVSWSGNALPIPKIQLHTPNFVPIGFTKGLVSIRFSYAHGWFNVPYIQGVYLHQKSLYGRFGKPNWKVRFYAGLNHQAMWGGRADYLKGTELAVNGQLPTSVRDYINMVFARYPEDFYNDRYTVFDGTNRIGNHVGNYDFGLEWNGSKVNAMLYYQHMYEDDSGIAFVNFPDGLKGFRLRNRTPLDHSVFRWQGVVVECLSTTNQSGPTFDIHAKYQGRDNYFNHGQYREGWSYYSHTIGTPFIAPRAELSAKAREYTGGGYFPNNRLVAWYLGFEGLLFEKVTLTARFSASRNFGTYNQGYTPPLEQVSSLLSARIRLPRWGNTQLAASVAADRGQLFTNTIGGYLSIRKNW